MQLRSPLSRTLTLALLLIAAGQSANSAVAAPINYQESVSGDLSSPGFGNPLTTLALDLGTNTVSGNLGQGEESFDVDSFAFTIPAGAQLVSGQVSVSEVTGGFSSLNWTLSSGSANSGIGTSLGLLSASSPGVTPIAAAPLGAGVYNFTFGSATGMTAIPSFADYTFTLELRAVPEPGSLALLATGLIGVMALRRRRQQRS